MVITASRSTMSSELGQLHGQIHYTLSAIVCYVCANAEVLILLQFVVAS